ncbi:Panacea domain-containing protein [Salibacterium sp. K-3]
MAEILNFNAERKKKMQYKTDIFRVAEVLLSIESMTPKKLQKMCYYFYAWHSTLKGEPPFENNFEAWVHGPVDPKLYNEYRSYGWNTIPQSNTTTDLPEDIIGFAHQVYSSYGHLNGDQLEYLTHQEPPWKIARKGMPEYMPSREEIQDENIIQYHKKVLENGQVE